MVPYSKITFRPIKPCNFYTDSEYAKESFLARFNDEESFKFLHYFIKYCCEKNKGEWPSKITSQMLKSISEDFDFIINIEDLKIFRDGYFVKNKFDYELTHELIVLAYMCCSDGRFLALSTYYLDFSAEEKLAMVLRNEFSIKEPESITFLLKVITDISKTPGMLMDREFVFRRFFDVAKKNNLPIDSCIGLAQKYNLIVQMVGKSTFVCNKLVLLAYLAMPKLN